MKPIPFTLFLMAGIYSSAQIDVNPVIATSMSASLLESESLTTTAYSISPGIEINNRLNINLDLTYVQTDERVVIHSNSEHINSWVLSTSVLFRVIESNSILSPMFGITVGRNIHTMDRGDYIENNVALKSSVISDDRTSYDAYGFVGRARFLLDMQWQFFSMRFGPTYGFHELRIKQENGKSTSEGISYGIGVEIGTVFSFGDRKKQSSVFVPGKSKYRSKKINRTGVYSRR